MPQNRVWVRFPDDLPRAQAWVECPYYEQLTYDENLKEWSQGWAGSKRDANGWLIRDQDDEPKYFPKRVVVVISPTKPLA